tara:strand:+ start:294 stop:473 length:180 start_codon:yes stop_codon:yes gene_type:complete
MRLIEPPEHLEISYSVTITATTAPKGEGVTLQNALNAALVPWFDEVVVLEGPASIGGDE